MKKLYTVFTLIAFTGLQAMAQNLVNDGGIININPAATITVAGNFTNNNASAVNNSGVMEVAGNFTSQNSSTQSGAGTFRFNGPSMQTVQVDNNIIASAIEIDNPVGISMVTNIEGVTALHFVNGYIFSGANTLGLDNINGAVTGADATRFFICGDFGRIKYNNVGNGDTAFYPVGYAIDTYNPAWLTNSGVSDNFSVKVFNDVLDGGLTGNSIPVNFDSHLVNRTWDIEEDVAGGTVPGVKLQWEASHQRANFSGGNNIGMSYFNNSNNYWNIYPQLGNETGTDPYTYEYNYTGNPPANMGAFIIGDGISMTIFPESVEENTAGVVTVFPNPSLAGSPLLINSKALAGQEVGLNLYDNIGRVVYSLAQIADNTGTLQVSRPTIPAGIYMLTLAAGNKLFTTRLVVE